MATDGKTMQARHSICIDIGLSSPSGTESLTVLIKWKTYTLEPSFITEVYSEKNEENENVDSVAFSVQYAWNIAITLWPNARTVFIRSISCIFYPLFRHCGTLHTWYFAHDMRWTVMNGCNISKGWSVSAIQIELFVWFVSLVISINALLSILFPDLNPTLNTELCGSITRNVDNTTNSNLPPPKTHG